MNTDRTGARYAFARHVLPALVGIAALATLPCRAETDNTVTLLSPANGTTLSTLVPDLVHLFLTNSGAAAAEIDLCEDAEFQGDGHGFMTLPFESGRYTNNTAYNLRPSTTMYWRGRAVYGDLNNPTYGPYTPTWTFRTGNGSNLPLPPDLFWPANGQSNATPSTFLTLQWRPAAGAVEYAVYLHRQGASNFTSWVFADRTNKTINVSRGNVYYWWVRTRNVMGWSAASEKRYFTVNSDSGTNNPVPIPGYEPPDPYVELNPPSVRSGNLHDWDGDHKADPWRLANGAWTVWPSGSNYAARALAAAYSGTPLFADFDGDNLADLAVVTGSTWHIALSTAAASRASYQSVSLLTGIPVADDFDGDLKADPAFVNGTVWTLLLSGQNYIVSGPFDLGLAGVPAPSDYDGDRKADPAAVAGANWFLWLSSASYQRAGPFNLGVSGTPVPADYDADGKADPAVMVEATSTWHIFLSSDRYTPISVALP